MNDHLIHKKILKNTFVIIILLSISQIAQADVKQHTKLWMNGTVIGPVSENNNKIKYIIESRLRLIDDKYVFEYYRISGGLGYAFIPSLAVFAGAGYIISKSVNGVVTHEDRPFQLMKWTVYQSDSVSLANNLLMEERKQLESPPWAYRLREKIAVLIPFKHWENHAIYLSNEFFFNLNHPAWVSRYFYSENRAVIGINTKMTQATSLMIGYINQYQHTTPKNIMSNGLILALDVNFK